MQLDSCSAGHPQQTNKSRTRKTSTARQEYECEINRWQAHSHTSVISHPSPAMAKSSRLVLSNRARRGMPCHARATLRLSHPLTANAGAPLITKASCNSSPSGAAMASAPQTPLPQGGMPRRLDGAGCRGRRAVHGPRPGGVRGMWLPDLRSFRPFGSASKGAEYVQGCGSLAVKPLDLEIVESSRVQVEVCGESSHVAPKHHT